MSVSVATLYVGSIGIDQLDWPAVFGLAILCPSIIAPPIVYFQSRAYHQLAEQREKLTETRSRLEQALAQVNELTDLLPICAWCHRVRDDEGYWEHVEEVLARNTRRAITHGVCPDCSTREIASLEKPRADRVR